MKHEKFKAAYVAVLFGVLLVGNAGAAQPGARDVNGNADRILREMGDYLRTADAYTFRADINYDEVVDDQMIQFGGVAQLSLQRGAGQLPDRLNVSYSGDDMRRRVVFDGKTITTYSQSRNIYATTQAPSEIDLAPDRLFEVFGSSVPIADLVYADPYLTLIENAETGYVVGQHPVNDVECHHLAFTQETIDW